MTFHVYYNIFSGFHQFQHPGNFEVDQLPRLVYMHTNKGYADLQCSVGASQLSLYTANNYNYIYAGKPSQIICLGAEGQTVYSSVAGAASAKQMLFVSIHILVTSPRPLFLSSVYLVTPLQYSSTHPQIISVYISKLHTDIGIHGQTDLNLLYVAFII